MSRDSQLESARLQPRQRFIIYGLMALNNHPFWRNALDSLLFLCDGVVIRWDGRQGDPEILKQVESLCGDKLIGCFVAPVNMAWQSPDWREQMLQVMRYEIQNGKVPAPDIVLTPDEDEIYGDDIKAELEHFYHSDAKGMMFSYYPLESDDGRVINHGVPYPPDAHMKGFKYEHGISYFPYHGNSCISRYANPKYHWLAKTKIHHYAVYKKAMEESKTWRSNIPGRKGRKAVTLLGFGPSRDQAEIRGEVWGVNNAYESFPKELRHYLTRIFEMHDIDKRDKVKTHDERLHMDHLDVCGKDGVRIIMQEPHPLVTNSEAYPLYRVIRELGIDWFAGTPCYMVPMAIMEGFTEIYVYGLDQLDYEHIVQRECFAGWMMYARGRGIKIDGVLTFLKRHSKRYGYDYGPEWDDYQNDLLWQGHPMTVKYHIPSRAKEGKLFKA